MPAADYSFARRHMMRLSWAAKHGRATGTEVLAALRRFLAAGRRDV